ncbi:hypothetical protein ACRYCC_26400 [Actinomadura scrupuli]|uniref:hypothetical protein n=1 Tax=Actinomadura scrupuli TaxID=559629 RepID=UPI003D9768B4
MGQRWTAPGGWDVEAIVLNGRPCLRVRLHRSLVGYAYSMAELERMLVVFGISVSDLVEVED